MTFEEGATSPPRPTPGKIPVPLKPYQTVTVARRKAN
jgi:hypothetical protein